VRSLHEWRFADRVSSNLKLDYVRDSTLTSELTDSGRSNIVANRDAFSVQPGMVLLVDEETSLNASFLYSDVAFDAGSDSGLVDYEFKQISAGANHIIDERLSIFLSGFASEFVVADIGSNTLTYGGQSGITFRYSSTFEADAAIGYVKSDIDFVSQQLALVSDPFPRVVVVALEQSVTTSGPIASVSLRKTFEKMRGKFDYVRRVSPSIRGSQTLEDDISATLERYLSRQWTLGFRGSYNMRAIESDEIDIAAGDLNRDQALVGASLAYQVTRNLVVRTEYRFARQLLSETDSPVYVNALFFSLGFNCEPHFFRGL